MEIIPIPAKKKTPNITKVGIYARVSTSRAEQLRSLSAQVSTLTQYVYDRYDWVLRDVYIDVGSAKTGSSRREFDRMIEDCKSGKLDYILVKSPSRLGRDSSNEMSRPFSTCSNQYNVKKDASVVIYWLCSE